MVDSVLVGTPVFISAAVSGSFGVATGTATFYVKKNSAAYVQFGAAQYLVSGAILSTAYYPMESGTYKFKYTYSGNGTYLSATSTETSLTVIDNYIAQYWTLNIYGGSGGSTNPSGLNRQYIVGETVTVTANPNQGYQLDRWLQNGLDMGSNLSIQVAGIKNQVINLQPEFSAIIVPPPTPTTWALTLGTVGDGTTSPAPGSMLVTALSKWVMAQARAGSSFVNWLLDGTTTITENPYTLTATFGSVHTLVANFVKDADPPVPPDNPVIETTSLLLTDVIGALENFTAPTFDEFLEGLTEA